MPSGRLPVVPATVQVRTGTPRVIPAQERKEPPMTTQDVLERAVYLLLGIASSS
jgi:hypothetical protein